MRIEDLFKFDIKLYNFLLIIKIIGECVKNREFIKEARRSKSFKNSEAGKTIYICGNGPSLKKVDFHDIKEDYLVVNNFYKCDFIDSQHPPKYYMILDEDFLEDNYLEDYRGILNPGFFTTYLINGKYGKRIRRDYPERRDIYYFCPWGKLYSNSKEFDFSRVHGRTWNVISEAILFAIYAGYKEIRLLGYDYNNFTSNQHFYSNNEEYEEYDEFPSLKDTFYRRCFSTEVHYRIAAYAEEKGVKIMNMSKESLLDAYPIYDL